MVNTEADTASVCHKVKTGGAQGGGSGMKALERVKGIEPSS
jgi:hypothetical protein